MAKRNKTKTCDPGLCDHCEYICEGDFICDKTMEIVVCDWEPTENFMWCESGERQKGKKHR